MDELFGEYQESSGPFDIAAPTSIAWRDYSTSRLTKAYWGGLNQRCIILDGELSTQVFESPRLRPSEKHKMEFMDLDAEVYALERLWDQTLKQRDLRAKLGHE